MRDSIDSNGCVAYVGVGMKEDQTIKHLLFLLFQPSTHTDSGIRLTRPGPISLEEGVVVRYEPCEMCMIV